jgi:ketosteroid isomerase-like protein
MVKLIHDTLSRTVKGRSPAFVATGAALTLLLAACSPTEPRRPTLQQDLAAITNFNERYLKAINDEDIDALAKLTTEGHILTPPGGRPLVGKARIVEVTGRSFTQSDVREMWTPEETEVAGDLAYQRGTYDLLMTPKAGGESRAIKGWFLRIYHRQPDGEWRMTRDMFNIDNTPTSEAQAQ